MTKREYSASHDREGVLGFLSKLGAERAPSGEGCGWIAQCPNPDHEDSNPSFAIDIYEKYPDEGPKVWAACRVCRFNGADACDAVGLPRSALVVGAEEFASDGPPRRRAPAPAEEKTESWRDELREDRERMSWLRRHRGLSGHVIRRCLIGWDPKRNAYTLPVFDEVTTPTVETRIVSSVLWWDPERKIRALRGHQRDLYDPAGVLSLGGGVLLCEGEADALSGLSHELPAVGVPGVNGWRDEWADRFDGRLVAISFDCDEAGRDGAERVARALAGHAREVRVVDLRLDDGEDLTDWFVKYRRTADDLKKLIRRTPPGAGPGQRRTREGDQ